MKSKIFKIVDTKENRARLDLFIDWGAFLTDHSVETIETLKEENLTHESMKLYRHQEVFFIWCSSEVQAGADQKPSNQTRPINRVHKKLWQQLEKELSSDGLPAGAALEQILYTFSVE